MLTSVGRTMILLFLIGASASFAQERERKPESISTEPKLLVVELKTADGKTVKVSGEAVFKLEEANSDDTMTGKLTYSISSDSRQEVARVMGKPLPEIPERVTVNDALVGFVRNPRCPDLQVEFLASRTNEVEIAGAKARLDRFGLTFRETSQELPKLLCIWAWGISNGHGHPPIRVINHRLKGENDE